MAARSIGSGTVCFGLVSIPIKLYSSSRPNAGVSFNFLHGECGSRIRQQYHCPTCDRSVERRELVRGYQFAKDQFVRFTDQELKALEAESSRAIEIQEFVPLETVDPIYFDRAYYLGPDTGAEKAFRLLTDAMSQADKVAIAKHILHGKEHVVVLRPSDRGLVLHTAFFADEIRDATEVDQGATVTLRDTEMTLAGKLIEELASERFQPEKYTDQYRQQLLALVEAKVEGQEVTAAPPEARRAQVIDLMEALKQSLAKSADTPATSRRPARAKSRSGPTRTRKTARK